MDSITLHRFSAGHGFVPAIELLGTEVAPIVCEEVSKWEAAGEPAE
ncbi:hypothetical protein [Paenibacillus sp.]|jgi:hypothetical protein|nr:hypothetical protein [Paenibacillus sp.]